LRGSQGAPSNLHERRCPLERPPSKPNVAPRTVGFVPSASLGTRFEGDIEYGPMLTGESCGVVNDIKPAAQIVKDLVRDAEAASAGAPTA
jgi:hypothetical protein